MEAHLDQAKHLFFNLVGGDKSGKNTWADDAGADDASIPDGPPLWQHPTFVDMYGRPFTTSHYASETGSSDPIANQLNSGAALLSSLGLGEAADGLGQATELASALGALDSGGTLLEVLRARIQQLAYS